MKYFYLLLVISIFFVACSGNKQQKDEINVEKPDKIDEQIIEDTINPQLDTVEITEVENDEVDEYYSDPLVVSYTKISDTMIINEDCAILLWPDSLELVAMQEKYPEGYVEILDDMIYYASDAAMALNDAGIKNFFCDKTVIQFINSPKDYFIERKKTEGSMIFLKQGKEPYITYSVNFNLDSCKNYFSDIKVDSITTE